MSMARLRRVSCFCCLSGDRGVWRVAHHLAWLLPLCVWRRYSRRDAPVDTCRSNGMIRSFNPNVDGCRSEPYCCDLSSRRDCRDCIGDWPNSSRSLSTSVFAEVYSPSLIVSMRLRSSEHLCDLSLGHNARMALGNALVLDLHGLHIHL